MGAYINIGNAGFQSVRNEQIKRKQYSDKVAQYTGNLLLDGITYNRDTKQHECRIEKYA